MSEGICNTSTAIMRRAHSANIDCCWTAMLHAKILMHLAMTGVAHFTWPRSSIQQSWPCHGPSATAVMRAEQVGKYV